MVRRSDFGQKCEYRLQNGNVLSCGKVALQIDFGNVGPFPALQWQIPEQITRMSGVAHNPDIQNMRVGQEGTVVGPT